MVVCQRRDISETVPSDRLQCCVQRQRLCDMNQDTGRVAQRKSCLCTLCMYRCIDILSPHDSSIEFAKPVQASLDMRTVRRQYPCMHACTVCNKHRKKGEHGCERKGIDHDQLYKYRAKKVGERMGGNEARREPGCRFGFPSKRKRKREEVKRNVEKGEQY